MSNNLKKRIYTSVLLLILLTLMFINIYVLAYFLMIIGVISILEFSKIIQTTEKNITYKVLVKNILFSIYIFGLFSIFLVLSFFPHLKILIFIILLTCISSDIGGYVFGNLFKGPKLTKISPKKTISGSIGSILFSMFSLSFLIYYFTEKFELDILIAGLSISIFCQVGDLIFSYLKRKSKIKDTGNILPGHGGILDRIDGILFGMPFGFIIMLIIY